MTIQEAIQKAIEGGYEPHCLEMGTGGDKKRYLIAHPNKLQVVMSPSFWQSLNKAMDWQGDRYAEENYGVDEMWFYHWHRFIDALADGRTVEQFFETLT